MLLYYDNHRAVKKDVWELFFKSIKSNVYVRYIMRYYAILLFVLFVLDSNEVVLAVYAIITWSTTERREIRNFPNPSVFELIGR